MSDSDLKPAEKRGHRRGVAIARSILTLLLVMLKTMVTFCSRTPRAATDSSTLLKSVLICAGIHNFGSNSFRGAASIICDAQKWGFCRRNTKNSGLVKGHNVPEIVQQASGKKRCVAKD